MSHAREQKVDNLLPDEPAQVRDGALITDKPDVFLRVQSFPLLLARPPREVQVDDGAHALGLLEVPLNGRGQLLVVDEGEPDALAVVWALAYDASEWLAVVSHVV